MEGKGNNRLTEKGENKNLFVKKVMEAATGAQDIHRAEIKTVYGEEYDDQKFLDKIRKSGPKAAAVSKRVMKNIDEK